MDQDTPATKPDGFTIIEIIIVLAIAALILLIVFLAVPALQRSARNMRRKRDAATIASARQEYDLNTQGTSGTAPATSYTCAPGFGSPSVCASIQENGLSYYDMSNITIYYNPFQTPPTSVPSLSDADHIISANYLTCNSSNTGATTLNATLLSMVILYDIESSSGPQLQCLQSSAYANN